MNIVRQAIKPEGNIMDFLKNRSALWWIVRILGGIGFAACLLLIIVLITLIG